MSGPQPAVGLHLAIEDRRGQQPTRTVLRPESFAVLGRDPATDVVLDDPTLSARQVYLQQVDGRTFWVGLHAAPQTAVAPGVVPGGWLRRELQVGRFWIRPVASPATAEDPGDDLGPLPIQRGYGEPWPELAVLRLQAPDGSVASWRINRAVVLIGRQPICKVGLTGSDVSGVHAALVRTASGLEVIDLLGRTGVVVNGQRVRTARLSVGDRLVIGGYRGRLELGEPPALAVARPVAPAVPPGAATADLLVESIVDPNVRALLDEVSRLHRGTADQFEQALRLILQTFSDLHREQMELVRTAMDRLERLAAQHPGTVAGTATAEPALPPPLAPTLRLVTTTSGTPQPSVSVPPTAPRAPDDPRAAPAAPGRLAAAADQVHEDIVQRIVQLQHERQHGWRLVLNALTGGLAGSSNRETM